MKLTNHETRRQRGELIQQFKLVNGLDRVNWHVEPQTIAKSGRLRRELVKNCLPRFNFYTNRIVNPWNNLAEDTKQSTQVETFKAKLDLELTKASNCYGGF
jgi:hypothetical protein